MQLSNIDAQPNLPVKDLEAARAFYEEVLELERADFGDAEHGVQGYKAGRTVALVYQSEYAGTNKATAMTWALGDRFDEVVAALRAKGVRFERYDMPDMSETDGVYEAEGMKVAWFKDPDGNIFNIGSYAA